jgi:hypothetical protein
MRNNAGKLQELNEISAIGRITEDVREFVYAFSKFFLPTT